MTVNSPLVAFVQAGPPLEIEIVLDLFRELIHCWLHKPLMTWEFSTMTREEIIREIYNALEQANQMRDPHDRIVCAEDTSLYGRDGCLDSLGLVSLIMDVEMAVREQAGTRLVL